MGKKSDLVVMAVLLGAHGVRGDCRLKSFAETSEDALVYGPLLNADGEIVLTPQKARPAKDHFVVTPKEHHQKEYWDGLKGTLLHIHRDDLPEAGDDEIYIDDLVGLAVQDVAGGAIGAVKAVHNFGAGDLIEVTPTAAGKTVLVPFTQVDVPEVDLAAGHIVVATLELWADESGAPEQGQA